MTRWTTLALLSLGLSALVACASAAAPAESLANDETATADDEAKKDKLDRFERDGSVFDSAAPEKSTLAYLKILPDALSTGYDGVHAFKVPVGVFAGGEPVTLTLSDPAAGTVAPVTLVDSKDDGSYFMIDVKKAGTFTLTAKSGDRTATATLAVASYEADRWAKGEARYNHGPTGEPACASCHAGGNGIDHSPAALASVGDFAVGRIVTNGIKPSRDLITTACTDCSDDAKHHRWTASDDELAGLVTYLRALEPRGFTP